MSKPSENPGLHCPVYTCKAPVTRVLRQSDLDKETKASLGEELDCANENHVHFSCGTLVRIPDTRRVYQMPPDMREREMAKHGFPKGDAEG